MEDLISNPRKNIIAQDLVLQLLMKLHHHQSKNVKLKFQNLGSKPNSKIYGFHHYMTYLNMQPPYPSFRCKL